MAGIGFELNKIMAKGGYTSLFQAYAYAGLIGSGPWLIAVLSMGLLGLVLTGLGNMEAVRLFFVSISVIYGFTLVLTGPIQMVLTRYAADQQFSNRMDKIFPAYISSMAWIAPGFAALGLVLFVGLVPGPMLFRLSAALLTVLVAMIWITGVFLSALKNYHAVLFAFAGGCCVSFFSAWALAIRFGTGGVMLGITLGHAVLLLILGSAIFREIGRSEATADGLLPSFRKYWDLAVGGLFYNLGIWIDKFLYWWFDPGAEQIAGILYSSPVFDRVVFFSFLTIIPGMAVFLLKLETEFAGKNHAFYQHVLKKATLGQILELKQAMIEALRDGLALLLKIQGLTTGLLILSTDRILGLLGLGAVQGGVFQVSLVGAFLLMIFLAMQTILYYLDKRRDALACGVIFTLVNGGVTALGIQSGDRWFGFGFLAAAAAALLFSALRVNYHLRNIDYDTFTSQPMYR